MIQEEAAGGAQHHITSGSTSSTDKLGLTGHVEAEGQGPVNARSIHLNQQPWSIHTLEGQKTQF